MSGSIVTDEAPSPEEQDARQRDMMARVAGARANPVLGGTGTVDAPPDPPVPMPAAQTATPDQQQQTEDDNPFLSRLQKDPSLGEVSLSERARLNATEGSYRSTIGGVGALNLLKAQSESEKTAQAGAELGAIAVGAEPPKPDTKPTNYERVLTDLARYDTMRSYDGPLEAAVSLGGQLGAGLFSPESLITRIPGVAQALGWALPRAAETVAGRVAEAGISQGIVNAATDPVVQAGAIGGGAQTSYDPIRTALAFPMGVAIGGAVHGGTEAIGAATRVGAAVQTGDPTLAVSPAQAVAQEHAALATEDPSMRSEGAAAVAQAPTDMAPLPTEPPADAIDMGTLPEAEVTAQPEAPQPLAPITELPARPATKGKPAADAKPLSLVQFIARNGGLELTGDAKGADLGKVFVPGAGPLARRNGKSIDGFWRERLVEAGYLSPDEDGGSARDITNELYTAIDNDVRHGEKTYAAADQNRIPQARDTQAEQIDAEAKKLTKALGKAGIADNELDHPALYDAAEAIWRGDETDPEVAYERAVMQRGASGSDELSRGVHEDYGIPFFEDRPSEIQRGSASEGGGAGREGSGVRDQPRPQGGDAGSRPWLPQPGEAGAFERTAAGNQSLIPGVAPVSERARLELQGSKPLRGGAAPAGGMFDETVRNQPDLAFRKRTAGQPAQPATAHVSTGEPVDHITSLQEQSQALADAVGVPLRGGRTRGGKGTLGQYDVKQDIVRTKSIADFETVAHEAGHAIEKRVNGLTAFLAKHSAELGPMDYDTTRQAPGEGFAEWVRQYLTAPASAVRSAPRFSAEFRPFMEAHAPETMASLDTAQAAHTAYVNAPSDVRLDTIVKTQHPETLLSTLKSEGMARTVSLVVGRAYETIFDEKAPVARAVRDLARIIRDASGARLDLQGADNPENLVRLFARSQQAAVQDMQNGVRPYRQIVPEGPALRDALIKATGSPGIFGRWDEDAMKEFANYLVARRSEVLWQRYDAGLLPNRPMAMSKADVVSALAEIDGARPTFRDASQMVHDYTRQLLRKQFEGGLIDRDLYDKLSADPFYVPLYRDMRDKPLTSDKATSGTTRSEGPGKADLIKKIKGSDRDIIDPIQSLMTQTFLVNRTIAHNDILKSFVALARQARETGATGVGRILEEIPAHQVVGTKFDLEETVRNAARQNGVDETDTKVLLGAMTDVFGDDPIMSTIFRREPTGKRGEPILFYKDGGQLRAVRLISKEEGTGLYEALAELPPQMRDIAINIGAMTASLRRAGIVTNPVFAVTNFVRDQLAVATLRSDYIPFNLRGIGREVSQDKYAQMYAYAGGVSPGAGAAGMSEMIDQSIEALARKGWAVQRLGGVADLVTKSNLKEGFKAISETVGVSESATRLNVMKQVFDQKKRQGLSDYDAMIEAASQATDVMDFGRHGSGMQQIRALVPFLNAHFQAIDKARRTLFAPLIRAARGDLLTNQDVADAKNAAFGLTKLLGVGGALGYAYGQWASQHDAYRDANADLRATHMIIPGGAFGEPGKILVIPKPFELAMGFNLGELAGQAVATGDPRVASFAGQGALEVLAPPNPLSSIPIVSQYAELALNKSFFTGRPIVSDEMQKRVPAQQFTDKTSAFSKWVGRTIGVSPIKVDYAIGSQFGLWGRDILAASNVTSPDAPAAALEDTMFLRRFIKSADSASETTKQFWQLAGAQNGQYAQAKNTYEGMLGRFKDADASAFLGALPAPERVYVTLQSAAGDDGKLKFTADERRIHPLTRAGTAVLTLNGMIRDFTANAQRDLATGERVDMDPQKRRQVIDNLRILAAMEQRNALIITGQPGYQGRPLLSTQDQFNTIKAIDPGTAEEVATRYATAKVPPTEAIAKVWPEVQKRLLADGGQAEIDDLAEDATAGGYAFGGERVRKAPKRRIAIPAFRPPMPEPIQPAPQ